MSGSNRQFEVRSKIADHWSQGVDVVSVVNEALDSLDIGNPSLTQAEKLLAASKVDHFHGGGIETTEVLRELMGIPSSTGNLRGVDIGSGLGGPMRWFAFHTGAQMDGIDVTPAFVDISNRISHRLGMQGSAVAHVGDAVSLDMPSATYDFALMMALSCNIFDRKKLYTSAANVLKQGGMVGMLDIIKGDTEELVLPVPWSRDGSDATSLLLTVEDTLCLTEEAGFRSLKTRDVSLHALEWFKNENKSISKGREIGFEKFLPDFEKMVQSQIENLERGNIKFNCIVLEKL